MPKDCVDTQVFPMACQACGQTAAMPFFAGTTVETRCIRVGMRCSECGHEWRFEMVTSATMEDQPAQNASSGHRED